MKRIVLLVKTETTHCFQSPCPITVASVGNSNGASSLKKCLMTSKRIQTSTTFLKKRGGNWSQCQRRTGRS